MTEVANSRTGIDLDMAKLTSQPLLQSTYAEVLRLRVAIGMARINEDSDFSLGGYRIRKNQPMIIFSLSAALNEEAWAAAGRLPVKPLSDFYAERFLVTCPESEQASDHSLESPGQEVFSLEGLSGCWLPYGRGQRMCPGRHFAKNEILGTFAFLFTQFELELRLSPEESAKIIPDMARFPVGALPPVGKVPFMIRRRVGRLSMNEPV